MRIAGMKITLARGELGAKSIPAKNVRGKPQRKSLLRGSGHASITKRKKPHSFGDETIHGVDSWMNGNQVLIH